MGIPSYSIFFFLNTKTTKKINYFIIINNNYRLNEKLERIDGHVSSYLVRFSIFQFFKVIFFIFFFHFSFFFFHFFFFFSFFSFFSFFFPLQFYFISIIGAILVIFTYYTDPDIDSVFATFVCVTVLWEVRSSVVSVEFMR